MLSRMLLILVTLGLVACNTMEGVGKDVKKAGDKIEKAAERHK